MINLKDLEITRTRIFPKISHKQNNYTNQCKYELIIIKHGNDRKMGGLLGKDFSEKDIASFKKN